MLKQTVENYQYTSSPETFQQTPKGTSASPKGMILHIPDDCARDTAVLDIGFGSGSLGEFIKSHPQTSHWTVDGVDGFAPNCHNQQLFQKAAYRNIWHGYAQDIASDALARYDIICLLDVIEHLDGETAKWLMRSLLTSMGENACLFISTPLWFYPQNQQQDGDLEEHLIWLPATVMMGLVPTMYSVNPPLIGGFAYRKQSLNYIDLFQPSSNKGFTMEMGTKIAKALGMNLEPGIVYKFT